MLKYIYKNKHLANENFKDEFYQKQLPLFFAINMAYLVAIGFAFFMPAISYVLYIATLVIAIKSYVKRMNSAAKERILPE
jgi:hypothetical protein